MEKALGQSFVEGGWSVFDWRRCLVLVRCLLSCEAAVDAILFCSLLLLAVVIVVVRVFFDVSCAVWPSQARLSKLQRKRAVFSFFFFQGLVSWFRVHSRYGSGASPYSYCTIEKHICFQFRFRRSLVVHRSASDSRTSRGDKSSSFWCAKAIWMARHWFTKRTFIFSTRRQCD